jgi:hypothetical protein
MITKSRLLLVALLALAGLLTFFKIPLASSQGMTLVAAPVSGALPLDDLEAAVWRVATAVNVPLSAQIVARPIFPQANIKALTARAIYNESQIAFLVEWEDDSLDDSAIRVQDFTDSLALQFPLAEGQPFFCMGQQGGGVNIWHWKANWQAVMTARQDMDTVYPNMYVDDYPFADLEAGAAAPADSYEDVNYLTALAAGNLFASLNYDSPVEDLVSAGFGSLTAKPADMQHVWGHGEYVNGKWRVIFARDRVSSDAEDVHFNEGQVYFVAFAAWDGANEERNGQKSTSQWVSLQLGDTMAPPTVGQPAAPTRPDGEDRRSTANIFEGVPFFLVPMAALTALVILLAAGVWLFSKLPDGKR